MNLPRTLYIRAAEFSRSRRVRIIAIVILAGFAIFSLAGFVGVPLLVRYGAKTRLAADLHRPVTVGPVNFNPYTLNLNIRKIHVGMRGNPKYSFADIARLRVRASWRSLFHLAPIITRLQIEHPYLHLIRTGPHSFNFSDLLRSRSPAKKTSHFSISNITLIGGKVLFNDRVTNQQHRIEQINLGIPFFANFPADVDVYVRPLLEMVIDGSRLRATGRALPFKKPPESTINLRLNRLHLARYADYLPKRVPLKVPKGTLSCNLIVHFVSASTGPFIRITGNLGLDQLDLRDLSNAEILSLNKARVIINNLEPLRDVIALTAVNIEALNSDVVLNHNGTTNLTPLAGGGHSGAASAPVKSKGPINLSVQSFELSNSAINVLDNQGPKPIRLGLHSVQLNLKHFATAGQTPAPFNINGDLNTGGSVTTKGTLNFAQSKIVTAISFSQVNLPNLQRLAHSILAANITSGKLNAKANVVTEYAANHFNVHVQPADVSLDGVTMKTPGQSEAPLGWKQLTASIEQIDLATRTAAVKEIRAEGLRVFARRAPDGVINLAALIHAPAAPSRQSAAPQAVPSAAPSPHPHVAAGASSEKMSAARKRNRAEIAKAVGVPAQQPTPGAQPSPQPGALRTQQQLHLAKPAVPSVKPWRYSISSIIIEKANLTARDEAAPQPVE
ncbi:MAG: DUF748 domain-containing protein, partial [Candidatus Binataceae bacterium]